MKYYVQKTYMFEADCDETALMVADLKNNYRIKLVKTRLFNKETKKECFKSKKRVARKGYVYQMVDGRLLTILSVNDEDNTMRYKIGDEIFEDTICVLFNCELIKVPSNEVQLRK